MTVIALALAKMSTSIKWVFESIWTTAKIYWEINSLHLTKVMGVQRFTQYQIEP